MYVVCVCAHVFAYTYIYITVIWWLKPLNGLDLNDYHYWPLVVYNSKSIQNMMIQHPVKGLFIRMACDVHQMYARTHTHRHADIHADRLINLTRKCHNFITTLKEILRFNSMSSFSSLLYPLYVCARIIYILINI